MKNKELIRLTYTCTSRNTLDTSGKPVVLDRSTFMFYVTFFFL